MASLEERRQVIIDSAKEKSDLQMICLEKLDLTKIKKTFDLGKARYDYENCIKENFQNYSNLARLDRLNKIGNLN
jgi:hypothetical protein